MSSTNVPCVRGAQIVPTDRQVEIPPKEAKIFEIIEGEENVTIPTGNGIVKGKNVVSEGKTVMPIDTDKMKKDRDNRAKRAPSKYGNKEKDGMEI